MHDYCSQSWTNSYQSNWHTCYIWPTLRFSPKIGWSQKSAGLLRAPHYGRNHRIVFKNYDTFCTNKGYLYLANETNQQLLNCLMVQFNQISLPPLWKKHRFHLFRWQKWPPLFLDKIMQKTPLCCVFEVGDSDALRWKARRPENSSNGSSSRSCFYLYCWGLTNYSESSQRRVRARQLLKHTTEKTQQERCLFLFQCYH